MSKSVQTPHILLVENDPTIVKLLVVQLQTQNLRVTTAYDGVEGLRHAADLKCEDPISVILSNFDMPGMSGLDFLHRFRQKGFETPFIFLASQSDTENARKALRLGALDLVEKPHHPEVLIKVLNKAIHFGILLKDLDHQLRNDKKAARG
jgi:DNA-binding response OmpR family regulator